MTGTAQRWARALARLDNAQRELANPAALGSRRAVDNIWMAFAVAPAVAAAGVMIIWMFCVVWSAFLLAGARPKSLPVESTERQSRPYVLYGQRDQTPTLVDVNGDGRKDFVVLAWEPRRPEDRSPNDQQMYVLAHDGAYLSRLWASGPYVGAWGSDTAMLAVVGTNLVLHDTAGVVHVLDVKTGKELRSAAVDGGVRALCIDPTHLEHVFLSTGRRRHDDLRVLQLDTGSVRPAGANENCSFDDGLLKDDRVRQRDDGSIAGKVRAEGFWGTDTYASGGTNARVTLGTAVLRAESSAVGAYAVGWDHRSRGITWEHPLSAPGDQQAGANAASLVDRDAVYYAYAVDWTPMVGPTRLAAWSSQTESLLWTATLPPTEEGYAPISLGAGAGHVFVVVNNSLVVLDAKTGCVEHNARYL